MDKLATVIGNYIDRECDGTTTLRQAYVRGFRRAAGKCDAVIRSRTAENDALKVENAKLRALLQQCVNELLDTCLAHCRDGLCEDCDCWLSEHADELRELGIEAQDERA